MNRVSQQLALNLSITLPQHLTAAATSLPEQLTISPAEITAFAELWRNDRDESDGVDSNVQEAASLLSTIVLLVKRGDDFSKTSPSTSRTTKPLSKQQQSKLVHDFLASAIFPEVPGFCLAFSTIFASTLEDLSSSTAFESLQDNIENALASALIYGDKELRRAVGKHYLYYVICENDETEDVEQPLSPPPQQLIDNNNDNHNNDDDEKLIIATSFTPAKSPLETKLNEFLVDVPKSTAKEKKLWSLSNWVYGGKSANDCDKDNEEEEERRMQEAIRRVTDQDGEVWDLVNEMLWAPPAPETVSATVTPPEDPIVEQLLGIVNCIRVDVERITASMIVRVEESLLFGVGVDNETPETPTTTPPSKTTKELTRLALAKEERRCRGRLRVELRKQVE